MMKWFPAEKYVWWRMMAFVLAGTNVLWFSLMVPHGRTLVSAVEAQQIAYNQVAMHSREELLPLIAAIRENSVSARANTEAIGQLIELYRVQHAREQE